MRCQQKLHNIFFFMQRKKNAFLLVLVIEEIGFQPELSSPPRFRIQGRYPERYGGGQRKEILVSNIGLTFLNYAATF